MKLVMLTIDMFPRTMACTMREIGYIQITNFTENVNVLDNVASTNTPQAFTGGDTYFSMAGFDSR